LRTLDRYLLREVGVAWAAVTGVLLVILVANQLAQVLGQAVNYRYPKEAVFLLIALTTVQNLTVLVPVGLLLGIVLALGRLYADSEMAAMAACGVGTAQLYRPVFILAALVAAALAWLCLDLAPRAFAAAQSIRIEALKAAQFAALDAGRFHPFAGGSAVFYAESVDAGGDLHRVFIERRTEGRLEVAVAERARHFVQEGGLLHVIVLYDGERYAVTPGSAQVRRMRFAEHGIPIRVGDPVTGPARVETRPTLELARSPLPADQGEFQWRVSLPIMALLLTLLAVPLARLEPRQGRFARLGAAILVYFVYSNLAAAGRSWIDRGVVPPTIGLWWVHGIVLLAALWLLWRIAPPAWALARRR
jgi:lipopolysaccharide export system permease protein